MYMVVIVLQVCAHVGTDSWDMAVCTVVKRQVKFEWEGIFIRLPTQEDREEGWIVTTSGPYDQFAVTSNHSGQKSIIEL